MPTKKKRIGFIPREEVLRIIDKLSTENNLSNSKIISILVEEALSIRGIFNKSYVEIKKNAHVIIDNPADFINNTKLSNDSKLRNKFNTNKSTQLNETNQDIFDLETYKKFLLFLKFQEMMDKYDT